MSQQTPRDWYPSGAGRGTARHSAFYAGLRNEIDRVGLVVRLICALAFTRLMRSLLFAVAPTDMVTFLVAVSSLTLGGNIGLLSPSTTRNKRRLGGGA